MPRAKTKARTAKFVPRGQVPVPAPLRQYLDNLYNAKGGLSGFSNRAGIKSDTLRLAMKRGTTTQRTLDRLTKAVEKAGGTSIVVASNGRGGAAPPALGQDTAEAAVQVDRLPPAVLRQIERVSGALLDGMQLMQLTVLKALQEELGDGYLPPPRLPRLR